MSNLDDDSDDSEDEEGSHLLVRDPAVRLRRGRGGHVRVDRRPPFTLLVEDRSLLLRTPWRRGCSPMRRNITRGRQNVDPGRSTRSRISRTLVLLTKTSLCLQGPLHPLRGTSGRRLDDPWRYDAARGGGLGVAWVLTADDERVIIDDTENKYITYRTTL